MFNLPKVNFKTIKKDEKSGVFEFSPLQKGFGNTLGSVLRRTLYSSAQGSAITKVRIEGINHKFSTIDGADNDVLHILLNLKKVRFEKTVEEPVELALEVKGDKEVTAGDIESVSGCKVVNTDFVITNLTGSKSKIKIYLTVESGIGYKPLEETDNSSVGTIVLDAIFSPIVNISYLVEDTRVGRDSNYEKLIFSLESDGSADCEALIREAARVLKEYFYRIQTGEDFREDVVEKSSADESSKSVSLSPDEIALEELHLPTRTINALRKAGIKTLGDLADRPEEDLLKIRNLGEKSIQEILSLLEKERLNS